MSPRWLSAIRSYRRRRAHDAEMEAELRFHLEREVEERLRRGQPRDLAEAEARRALGPLATVKEEGREARAGWAVETLVQDVRHGLRVLRRNPGFTAAVVATLALGIGASTAVFSVAYGVLLRPLPYANGARLVVLHQKAPHVGPADVPFSVQEIADYRQMSHTLDGVVEHHTMVFLLLGDATAERVQTAVVSANFFDVLGVRPLMGRTFRPEDEAHGADAVLVLGYRYWMKSHGGDPAIVGRVFRMNDRPHTVIGVLPPIPQYPVEDDVYMPTSQCPTRSSHQFIANRGARMMTAFARLKPGASLDEARADLAAIAGGIRGANPATYPPQEGYTLEPAALRDDLTQRSRAPLLVLLGAAFFVLVIACANVANLLLARLLASDRELAVRTALGASKGRLVRQLLTESLLLSVLGAVAGLALTPAAVGVLTRFAARLTTRAGEVRVDVPVLLFAVGLAVLTGLVFGIAPALAATRQIADPLRAASSRVTASRAKRRLRAALVVAQVAVSVVLLAGTGLVVRSLTELLKVSPGFQPEGLVTARLTPNFTKYADAPALLGLLARVLEEVRSVPGVASAALVSNPPFSPSGIASGPGQTLFEIEGRPTATGDLAPRVDVTIASPGYFDTLRQPLAAGRGFTESDDAERPLVGVVNRTMARHRFPGEDPVGRRISIDGGQHWISVVGVVEDAREYGLNRPASDEVYLPLAQSGFAGSLMVRTTGDPRPLLSAVREAVRRVDPHVAVDRESTLDAFVSDSVATPRVTATLLGLFSVFGLVVSAAGVAAVVALTVSQRTHELGIRLALGATRVDIARAVVSHGMTLAVAGILIGCAGAVGLGRVMASLLFGVSPNDAVTFTGVAAVFLAVTALACLVPARRVTAIDPVDALRHE
jgi:putative ABC transport system permease protein